jgi:cation diffusion facilitator CzcD-associated flavoprotein CzcO
VSGHRPTGTTPRFDVVVVGAGLIGLATADALLQRRPDVGGGTARSGPLRRPTNKVA